MANRYYRIGAATLTGVDEPTLRLGSSGDWVSKLQMRLNKSGASGGDLPVTGDFTADTEQQVKNFQAAYGLTVDGVVGPQTWGKLLDVTGIPDAPPAAKKTARVRPDILAPFPAGAPDWEPFALGGLALLGAFTVWRALS